MTFRAVAAGAAILAFMGAGSTSLSDELRTTAASYLANVVPISKVTGRESTMDYYQRLLDDVDYMTYTGDVGVPLDVWHKQIDAMAQLDVSLATQLLQGTYRPMASIRGLGETFVRSSKDGTMQPVAVYVPSGYVPGHAAPLVVFLHGRPQSETNLLSSTVIDDMAESTGTIVVAPYGRGYYNFVGTESDVYDVLDAATSAFTIDSRKRYLAGYSMGGFSVFGVAPIRAGDWAAVMCVSGSLLGSRARILTTRMPRTPFYVLTGALDESIPTQYPTTTAIFLRNSGIPVTFYSQPNGTHRLFSLKAIFAQAWSDMENGVVRTPTALSGGADLPMAPPPATFKT